MLSECQLVQLAHRTLQLDLSTRIPCRFLLASASDRASTSAPTPTAPLAMAQNMERVNEVMNFMRITQSLGPQGQLYLNQEKAMDFIADNLGIPASLRTTPQERQALVEQATQIAQQQMQQEGMMDGQGPGTEDQIPEQQ